MWVSFIAIIRYNIISDIILLERTCCNCYTALAAKKNKNHISSILCDEVSKISSPLSSFCLFSRVDRCSDPEYIVGKYTESIICKGEK